MMRKGFGWRQQPPSLADVVSQRRRAEFVGRAHEVALFTENLRLPANDSRKKYVLSITGQAGSGKTTLLQRLKDFAAEQDSYVAYVEVADIDPIEAMSRVADQLGSQGKHLRNFTRKLEAYQKKTRELESDPSAPRGLLAGIGRVTARGAIAATRQLPGASVALDMLPTGTFIEQSGELAEFAAKKLANRDERRLVLEPLEVLTAAFFTDIARKLKNRRVVILFDAYERATIIDPWFRNALLGKYGTVPTGIMWVSAGQQELDLSSWLPLEPLVARLSLESFSLSETAEYLSKKGISNPGTAEAIYGVTAGLPLMVAILASNRSNTDVPVGVADELSIERILAQVGDPALRSTLLDVAVCRWFNHDVLNVLTESPPTNLLDTSRRPPFIVAAQEGWTIHPAVRAPMLRELSRRSPQRFAELHRKLATYHEEIAGRTAATTQYLGAQGRWGKHFLEFGYHHLCSEPVLFLPVAIHSFLDSLAGDKLFSSLLAGSIRDAGHDAGQEEVRIWGERMERCLRSLVEIDPTGVGDFISQVLDYPLLIESYRAELLSERAWIYLARQELDLALNDAEQALALNPNILRARSARAHVLRQSGRLEEALAEFNQTFARDGSRHWDRTSIGLTYLAMGRFEEAIAEFDRALPFETDAPYIRMARGQANFALHKWEEAIADFTLVVDGIEHILDRAPNNLLETHYHKDNLQVPFVRALRGIAHAILRNADLALGDLNFSLRFLPDFAPGFSARGTAYWILGEYEDAEKDFSRAIELEPDISMAYLWRGKCRVLQDRYSEAITDVTKYIELVGETYEALMVRARAHEMLDHSEEALADFRRCTALDETAAIGWFGLASHQYRADPPQYDEALEAIDKTIALDPSFENVHRTRANILRMAKRNDEALTEISSVIEADPYDDHAIAIRADVLREMGKYEQGLVDANRAVEKNPDSAFAYWVRGELFCAMGDHVKAIDDYTEAIRRDPEELTLYAKRSHSYAEFGRFTEAVDDLDMLLAADQDNQWALDERDRIQQLLRKSESTR